MVRFGLPGSPVAAMGETFSSFVNPDIPIPVRIQQITGISDADVADALHFNALRLQVEEFIGEAGDNCIPGRQALNHFDRLLQLGRVTGFL